MKIYFKDKEEIKECEIENSLFKDMSKEEIHKYLYFKIKEITKEEPSFVVQGGPK